MLVLSVNTLFSSYTMPIVQISSTLMDIDPKIYASLSQFAEITGVVPAWAEYDVVKPFLCVTPSV